MEEFTINHIVVPQAHALICDVCGKKFLYGGTIGEILEIQEFLRINFVGGYSSVFGDMSRVKCDICQHCLKELIEEYCKIIDTIGETNANLLL